MKEVVIRAEGVVMSKDTLVRAIHIPFSFHTVPHLIVSFRPESSSRMEPLQLIDISKSVE
jgi:hypothetical protein